MSDGEYQEYIFECNHCGKVFVINKAKATAIHQVGGTTCPSCGVKSDATNVMLREEFRKKAIAKRAAKQGPAINSQSTEEPPLTKPLWEKISDGIGKILLFFVIVPFLLTAAAGVAAAILAELPYPHLKSSDTGSLALFSGLGILLLLGLLYSYLCGNFADADDAMGAFMALAVIVAFGVLANEVIYTRHKLLTSLEGDIQQLTELVIRNQESLTNKQQALQEALTDNRNIITENQDLIIKNQKTIVDNQRKMVGQ